jgi:hypothetical protein
MKCMLASIRKDQTAGSSFIMAKFRSKFPKYYRLLIADLMTTSFLTKILTISL